MIEPVQFDQTLLNN
jgi:hypothetical protein